MTYPLFINALDYKLRPPLALSGLSDLFEICLSKLSEQVSLAGQPHECFSNKKCL